MNSHTIGSHMVTFITAIIAGWALALYQKNANQPIRWWFYWLYVFALVAGAIFWPNRGHAEWTKQQHIAYYERRAEDAREAACIELSYANYRILDIKNMEAREKSRTALACCIGLAAPGTPYTKVMAALLAFLHSYGNHVLGNWSNLEHNLMCAAEHADQAVFFDNIVIFLSLPEGPNPGYYLHNLSNPEGQ